jgi:hypothetical protein
MWSRERREVEMKWEEVVVRMNEDGCVYTLVQSVYA